MNNRSLEDFLYEQVACVGKALPSPKRLEILEMQAHGDRTRKTFDGVSEWLAAGLFVAKN